MRGLVGVCMVSSSIYSESPRQASCDFGVHIHQTESESADLHLFFFVAFLNYNVNLIIFPSFFSIELFLIAYSYSI